MQKNEKKENNRKRNSMLAVLLSMVLIFSSFLFYFNYYSDKETFVRPTPDEEIDDRVSPYTPLAVFLEIHRIRRKGIIEHMENSGSKIVNLLPRLSKYWSYLDGLVPGKKWQEKPTFNYILIFDEFEYKGAREFNTWDTDYINRQVFRKVEDEQDKTSITVKFIEKEKKFLRNTENEVESFSVVYDFRTGRWSGDDFFNDSDGYGHFDGKYYEMWFTVSQTDNDGDDIPYWTEVNILKTNPTIDNSKDDPDNDKIPTTWEWKWGYDPFTWDNHSFLDPDNDGLQNTEEFFMEKWLANPFYPEIYIEVDFMEKTPFKLLKKNYDGQEHIFQEESQQMLIERFNQHKITVHIDDGVMGGGGEYLPLILDKINQEDGTASEFYHNNFADERKGIFRYIFINHWGGWCHPQDDNHWYDTMAVPSAKEFYFKYLGGAVSKRTQTIGRAVQVLHELGHSCGLRYEEWQGIDNMKEGGTTWVDYHSAMNYHYFALRYFDYSDGSRGGEHDRNDWEKLNLAYFERSAKDMEGLED